MPRPVGDMQDDVVVMEDASFLLAKTGRSVSCSQYPLAMLLQQLG